MSTIPYFLRNPNLDDQAQPPMTMAPAAAPQGMAAPVVQHPMHAMIAPIVGAPLRMSTMRPAEDPGQEPAAMSQGNISSVGGDQMSAPVQSTPSAIEPKQPTVRTMSPIERREDQLQQGMAQKPEGFWGNLRHYAGMAGRVAGDIVAPAETELVVRGLGKEGIGPRANEFRNQEMRGLEKEQSEQALQGAQISAAQQQGDLHEQQARAAELTPTTEEESDALGVPIGTMLNAASRAALSKQAGINQTRVTTNTSTNDTRRDVAGIQALSRETIAKLKPQQRDDRAIAINQKIAQGEAVTPEEGSYLKAYAKYIDQTKTQPGVQRMMALAQFRPVQALNQETGQPEWNWSGQAVSQHMGTTSNIPFRTAAGMAKFMTSGKGGQTINAYNVSNDHLDLFGKAMDALQNGDVQGLNRLNNAFKEQFGSPAPTNVNAIKAMLAGELANIAKVTGATDPEIQEQKANINRASSPEQIKGFIDTNHDLMDQKAYEMYQQYQQGMQGQPAFGTGRPLNGPGGTHPAPAGGNAGVPKGATHTVPGSDGKMHYTDGKNDLGVVK